MMQIIAIRANSPSVEAAKSALNYTVVFMVIVRSAHNIFVFYIEWKWAREVDDAYDATYSNNIGNSGEVVDEDGSGASGNHIIGDEDTHYQSDIGNPVFSFGDSSNFGNNHHCAPQIVFGVSRLIVTNNKPPLTPSLSSLSLSSSPHQLKARRRSSLSYHQYTSTQQQQQHFSQQLLSDSTSRKGGLGIGTSSLNGSLSSPTITTTLPRNSSTTNFNTATGHHHYHHQRAESSAPISEFATPDYPLLLVGRTTTSVPPPSAPSNIVLLTPIYASSSLGGVGQQEYRFPTSNISSPSSPSSLLPLNISSISSSSSSSQNHHNITIVNGDNTTDNKNNSCTSSSGVRTARLVAAESTTRRSPSSSFTAAASAYSTQVPVFGRGVENGHAVGGALGNSNSSFSDIGSGSDDSSPPSSSLPPGGGFSKHSHHRVVGEGAEEGSTGMEEPVALQFDFDVSYF